MRISRTGAWFFGLLLTVVWPGAAAAQSTDDEGSEHDESDHPDESARISTTGYARPNRLAISLGFGVGSADLTSHHALVGAIETAVQGANPGATIDGDLKSNTQINGEFSLRYYFPHHILAHVGFGAIYNAASVDISVGGPSQSLENHVLVMETPLLIGGYHTLSDRLFVQGAAGPSPFFFARSFWDPGTDFEADGGVGMHLMAGADYFLAEHFALGLELRYRSLKAENLRVKGSGTPLTSGAILGDGSTDTYDIDLSGMSVVLNIRIFAI